MILIADSGSTKADWIAGEDGSVKNEFFSKGFNPFFHDHEFILNELNRNDDLTRIRDNITELYFFGAGCSSPERNDIIKKALSTFFKNAVIYVDHDMLGTALAVCEGRAGIACILGTGSNICFFNGKDIEPVRHGLGYVLGDEGSGSYYGRKLLSGFLYKNLPDDLEKSFMLEYNLTREEIINKVYGQPNANVFLASFANFLSKNAEHIYVRELVFNGMNEFFDSNVLSYPESKMHPVHFVGSVAWFFKDILNEVAKQKGVVTGNIIQKPVSGLAAYFLNGGKLP